MGNKNDDINFEEAMKKLESIANQLEQNDLELDESVKVFEEGMNLSKKCSEILENAEKKITILLNDGKDNFSEESFDANQA
ncbi:MAG: exodeoxyribonuclease VII small subunit [Clostridia bacterium]|nr:exodeoxyribonuclease VII small subunit [Clostridia bacterium]